MARKRPIRKATRGPVRARHIDSSAEFERLLTSASSNQRYVLRLYIGGNSLRSAQSIANIRALCDEYLADRYDLEVIDIFQLPSEALRRQIIAAPTLIKELPIPPHRIIGDLTDRDRVLLALNLTKNGPTPPPEASP
jgi:circadian clock protein KaiB